MEGDNAYLCEELGRRVPAVKRACIKALPHTLVIHLKRFEFDYHSQTRFKVRDRFEFPEELDLFPYTADGLAAAEAEAANAAANGSEAGGSLGRQSSTGGGDAASASAGSGMAAAAHPEYMYDLAGIVVHSGSAFTGHYYSYAREREALAAFASSGNARRRSNGWFCFDDKSVRTWDPCHLESDCFGGRASQDFNNRGYRPPRNEVDRPHSAYMLFYERRCEWQSNVQALQEQGKGSQQQQQQAVAQGKGSASGSGNNGSGSGAPAPGAFVAPWGMPLSLYRDVMLANLTIMQHLLTLDREFFKFMRLLVENRGDVGGQLSQRKARRRELPPPQAHTVNAAAGSGGSCSAMSCDPPANGPAAGASGAAAAAATAPSTPGAPNAAADGGAGPGTTGGSGGAAAAGSGGGGGGGGSYEQLPSPGPSSRRGEEAEQVAVLLTRLALRFHMQLYQHAVMALRSDSAMWGEVLKGLLNAGPAAGACQLAALQLLHSEPAWLRALLVLAEDSIGARDFVADIVGFLLVHAAPRCQLHVIAPILYPPLAAGEQQQQPALAELAHAMPQPAALLMLVDLLVQMFVSSTYNTMASDAEDVTSVAALAAVLREYVVGAPPVCGAILVSHTDLVVAATEHLAALHRGGEMVEEYFRDDGPPCARLLYALVARASNLERLTLELSSSQHRMAESLLVAGAANPYAAAAAVRGIGGGGVVDAALGGHAFKRLHDNDVLDALTDPLLLCMAEQVPLLQLLIWENYHTTQMVIARLVTTATSQTGSALVHVLPHMIAPMKEVLSVRDSVSVWRAFSVLFYPTGASLLGWLVEGPNQHWHAIKKMMVLACFEGALRGLTQQQISQVMMCGLGHVRAASTLWQVLETLEGELLALESLDQQGAAPLIKQYVGAVTTFKAAALAHASGLAAQHQQRQMLAMQQQAAAAAAAAQQEQQQGHEQEGVLEEVQDSGDVDDEDAAERGGDGAAAGALQEGDA